MLRQPITLDADSVLGSIFVDKQGLPRKVLNNSNFTTAWDATYDEFGDQLTQNGTLSISLRYPLSSTPPESLSGTPGSARP